MRLVCLYFLSLFCFLFQNNNRGGYNVGDKTDKPATTAANQFNMVYTCSTVLPVICNNNLLVYSSFKSLIFISVQHLHVPSFNFGKKLFCGNKFLARMQLLAFFHASCKLYLSTKIKLIF